MSDRPKIGFTADISGKPPNPDEFEIDAKLRREIELAESLRTMHEVSEFHKHHGKPLPHDEMLELQGHHPVIAKLWENRKNLKLLPLEFSLAFAAPTFKTSLRLVCLLPERVLFSTRKIKKQNEVVEEQVFNETLAYRFKLAVEDRLAPLLAKTTQFPDHKWFLAETESALATEIQDLKIPVCRISVFPQIVEPPNKPPSPLGTYIGE